MKRILVEIQTAGTVDLGDLQLTMSEAESVHVSVEQVRHKPVSLNSSQTMAAEKIVAPTHQPAISGPSSSYRTYEGKGKKGRDWVEDDIPPHLRHLRPENWSIARYAFHVSRWHDPRIAVEMPKSPTGYIQHVRIDVLQSVRNMGFKSISAFKASAPHKMGTAEFLVSSALRAQEMHRKKELEADEQAAKRGRAFQAERQRETETV